MFRRAIVSIWSLALLTVTAIAQSPDIPEPASVEAIAAATTDPHFVSPWVSYVPQSNTVPSPGKFIGRIMGAPGELVGTEKTYAYARALAAASSRVRAFTIGHSEEGREILMLAIADEAGIRDLDRLKAATAALADPRHTDQDSAEKLIATARPIYYLNAALHSDETGSTEAMLELAFRLAVSEQPMIRRIREQMIVLINPISNPDGRDKMVDWFYRYLKGNTNRPTLPRQSPPYWSKYTFVDINRDTHQQTHETTKAVHRMFYEWHPTVVHDLHEGEPLLLTWNGTGPHDPNIDPITYAEFLELSFHEVQALTAMGMPGVSTWNFGESFANLYLESVAMNHNSMGRGYETFGNGSAETERRSVRQSDATVEWYRPLPAPQEVIMRELYDQSQDKGAEHNLAVSSPGVTDTLQSELNTFRGKTSSYKDKPAQTTLSSEQTEDLSALGYVASNSADQSHDPLQGPDPKDKVGISNTLHEGMIAVEDGRYQEAIPLLEHVLEDSPSISAAQLQLGVALARVKHYPEAIAALHKAVQLMPDSVQARYELGLALFETGAWQDSVPYFEFVAKKRPKWPDAQYSLASVYARTQHVPEAVELLQTVLQLNPQHFRANLLLGRILTLQHLSREALPYLKQAEGSEPDNFEPHAFLADALDELGESESATTERMRAQALKHSAKR